MKTPKKKIAPTRGLVRKKSGPRPAATKPVTKIARSSGLPPKGKARAALALEPAAAPLAAAGQFEATLAKLIALLESYGQVFPVVPATLVGQAAPSMNTLTRDVDDDWMFPDGGGYAPGEIQPGWATQTLARDIDNRGGIPGT